MTTVVDSEARRLWAIQYRKDNAEKIKQRHLDRMANDPDYVARYYAKVEKRRLKYQEEHKEAAETRKKLRDSLAETKKSLRAQKAVERNRKKRANLSENDRLERNEYARNWRELNKDRVNAVNREKRRSDPDYAERIRVQDRARPREQIKNTRLRNDYGITLDDFNRMREQQNYCCAVCGVHEDLSGVKRLAIDHCHTEGHIRGLLCSKCNTGLGLFRDNIDFLSKAIEYLKRS